MKLGDVPPRQARKKFVSDIVEQLGGREKLAENIGKGQLLGAIRDNLDTLPAFSALPDETESRIKEALTNAENGVQAADFPSLAEIIEKASDTDKAARRPLRFLRNLAKSIAKAFSEPKSAEDKSNGEVKPTENKSGKKFEEAYTIPEQTR